ncbi:hypothetical protein F4604DRAFT_1682809 [Suillus subluteus]|nr:hypothetical protein F4604DRAFT_1682809 [Suillus subluteus]
MDNTWDPGIWVWVGILGPMNLWTNHGTSSATAWLWLTQALHLPDSQQFGQTGLSWAFRPWLSGHPHMVLCIYSDGEEPPTSTAHPKCVPVSSAKLYTVSVAIPPNPPSTTSPSSSHSHKVTIVEVDDDINNIELPSKKQAHSPDPPKCANKTEHNTSNDASPSTVNPLHANSDKVDADGFLKDVQVMSINDSEASETPCQE